jgi:hypothetical protein
VPFQIEFEVSRRILMLRATGQGDAVEGYAAIKAVAGHPQLGRRTPVLMDLRELDFLPTGDEARTFGKEFAGILPGRRVALVTGAGAPYGVARAVEQLASLYGGEMAAFTSMDDARHWLVTAIRKGSEV